MKLAELKAYQDNLKELEEYRALGTVEEIKARLDSPFPQAESGYAPRVYVDDLRDGSTVVIHPFEDGQYSGLLEDDDYDPDWEEK